MAISWQAKVDKLSGMCAIMLIIVVRMLGKDVHDSTKNNLDILRMTVYMYTYAHL